MHTGFWWGNLRERDPLKDLVVDGRIILKWIFKKYGWKFYWINPAQDGEQMASPCEYNNES